MGFFSVSMGLMGYNYHTRRYSTIKYMGIWISNDLEREIPNHGKFTINHIPCFDHGTCDFVDIAYENLKGAR
jgi:hypothetical protein